MLSQSTMSQEYAPTTNLLPLKAVHTGPNASKASPDEAAGLEATICIAHEARVMLTANLWTETGLVIGAMGTIKTICYQNGKAPPDLPTSVTVKFDTYSGPTLEDGTVPITPIRRTWTATGAQCSRLQLPLKLAWAVTIHKAQGLTEQGGHRCRQERILLGTDICCLLSCTLFS